MGIKIFTSKLRHDIVGRQTDLDFLSVEIRNWCDQERMRGKPLRNKVIAQSHGPDEIIVTVWYDD